ncbi:MAG: hypothetical protein ACLFPF_07230 [Halanaerobiales bacterium]
MGDKMAIIRGSRQSGKTLQLLKQCADDNCTMICYSAETKKYISDLADKMGVEVDVIVTKEKPTGN